MNTISRKLAAGLLLAAICAPTGLARAQSPAATPTPSWVSKIAIPVTIPDNWKANGWDQAGWSALRQHCIDVFIEAWRRSRMSAAQLRGLSPLPADAESCRMLAGSFGTQSATAPPSAENPVNSPAPLPTPLPPQTSGWPAIGVAVLV